MRSSTESPSSACKKETRLAVYETKLENIEADTADIYAQLPRTRDNAAGYAEAAQHLRECAAIRFGAKLTLFGNKVAVYSCSAS